MFQEFENDLKNKHNSFPNLEGSLTEPIEHQEKTDAFEADHDKPMPHELLDLAELTKEPSGFPELPHYKDDLSNVVPGSQGPYDFFAPYEGPYQTQKPYFPPEASYTNPYSSLKAMDVADSMIEEFIEFLELKGKIFFLIYVVYVNVEHSFI